MTKTKKPHIPQSYFRRVRNWFSNSKAPKWFANLKKRFCCISGAEEDNIDEIPETLPEIPSPAVSKKAELDLNSFLLSTRKPTKTMSSCPCGGVGEHPVVPSRSLMATSSNDIGESSVTSSTSEPCVLTSKPASYLPECRLTTLAHKHQGNLKGSNVIGTQCTSTAFSAIVANCFLPCGLWTPRTLDRVLYLGDSFHEENIHALGDKAPASCYLSADEMPEVPEDEGFVWPVRCIRDQEIQGLAYTDPTRLQSMLDWWTVEVAPGFLPLMHLTQALDVAINRGKNDGCILTMNLKSMSIMKNPAGGYITFDSHAKDIFGFPSSDGAASLLRFGTIESLVSYLSMFVEDRSLFSVTGFRVEQK